MKIKVFNPLLVAAREAVALTKKLLKSLLGSQKQIVKRLAAAQVKVGAVKKTGKVRQVEALLQDEKDALDKRAEMEKKVDSLTQEVRTAALANKAARKESKDIDPVAETTLTAGLLLKEVKAAKSLAVKELKALNKLIQKIQKKLVAAQTKIYAVKKTQKVLNVEKLTEALAKISEQLVEIKEELAVKQQALVDLQASLKKKPAPANVKAPALAADALVTEAPAKTLKVKKPKKAPVVQADPEDADKKGE
jgi:hypothetical protein